MGDESPVIEASEKRHWDKVPKIAQFLQSIADIVKLGELIKG